MSSVEFDGTCIGPTAGDLVPGSRRVEKKINSIRKLSLPFPAMISLLVIYLLLGSSAMQVATLLLPIFLIN